MLRKGASGGQRQFHDVERDGRVVGLQDVVVAYPRSAMARRGDGVRAVDGVSLSISARGSLGLVGESGCGKTSLGRSIVGLSPLSSGEISLAERAGIRRGRSTRVMHRVARSVQIVLQDPYSSLDPRQSIGSTITEPMRVHGLGSSRDRRTALRACWIESGCLVLSRRVIRTSSQVASDNACASQGPSRCLRCC